MKGKPAITRPWTSARGAVRGSHKLARADRLKLNVLGTLAAAGDPVGDTAAETDKIVAQLERNAPLARAALCNRPTHAAWDAVRDAEAVVQGNLPRGRVDGPYIETLRSIEKVVTRHAASR